MARVELREVSKVYDKGVIAVNRANISIADREFVVLVGPSGCGKSTTLRMIAGLEEVSSGEIYIDDRLVNDVPPKDRDIAMVFQNYALYPHMTVFENMAFGLKLRKYPKAEIEARVKEAARILGIEQLLDRKPKALSGGQRQRVAVGRAIVRKPKVFLFDEPLSNLDAKLRVQTRIEISKLHSRLETTMVYVTHDQVEAMTMGDRIVVMKDGVVQQMDTPLNLYHYPANKFVAGFIGSPAMNFICGRVVRNGGLRFQSERLAFAIPAHFAPSLDNHVGEEVVFGIRPEDIHLAGDVAGLQETADVPGVVEVVEPMGSEIFLYVNLGATTLVARINSRTEPPIGSQLPLTFDMSKSHFFSAQTEESLRPA
ncbi:MAG: sn-glycerol-3-phosphate ABC transporter ATP-binding protein UgpC [candidate division KSB1 bacterium]|nr:sn-glycerol-3-phosphate ABC transporter ATP-binding protein UgpC [candidate division KSB1 bacterium]MDZ7272971.1 sn-glycerol-3-phosphate ABC transporter ATP-binding protein UgpC [candidate division KSB1 bacterium]MDZ7285075.1 sn-glycerol-3-phosphate ABC transporter ATP-binding protein UgpC [candidate division KSB1 bacterium]MDZ7298107.1 sn-glycerol-3-phosphate ABC transporter ATP-binding protein UgpC [candidate division KSB1 bacterium]MDZ7308216.1 sn-glycerol-3-phosphate ABC transporter ATP-